MQFTPRVALALTIVFVAGAAAAQQANVIEAGREYAGGRKLSSPLSGISFVVPDGFTAGYDPEIQGMLLANPQMQGVLGGVWGASDVSLEELVAFVAEKLAGAGVQAEPREQPRQTATEFSGSFQVSSPEGNGILFAHAKRGTDGNAILVAVMGPPGRDADVEQLTSSIAEGFEFTRPEITTYAQQLGGLAISSSSSSSDSSSGAGIGGSGSSQSSDRLDLCSNGQYAYEYSSESYVSIAGASSSSESGDQHTGTWALIADLAGQATIALAASDGREFLWSIEERGDDLYVQGSAHSIAQSQVCR